MLYMFSYMSLCDAGARKKREPDPLELELQEDVTYLWALGAKFGPFARQVLSTTETFFSLSLQTLSS